MISVKKVEELEDEITKLHLELKTIKLSHKFQNELDRKAREKAETNEKMLQSLVETAVGKIGQDFFDNIVIRLSEWLGADCVLIGRLTENEIIEAVPMYLDGKITQGFSYNLTGSPCDITVRKGYCSFTEKVISIFPNDQILVDLQAEGYIGTALFDKSGVVNGVICAVSRKKLEIPTCAQDILKIVGSRVTAEIERLKVEEDLSGSEKELRESNNTKDKFISIIAHDLKNSLNVINGFLEILMKNFEKYSPETQKKYLENIFLATKNSNDLLENLLTWALVQRGLIEFCKSELKLNTIIAETLGLLGPMALAKQITLNLKNEEDIHVYADVNMLTSVLRNLISNAIKFTPEGGKVDLSYRLTINKQVVIDVEDTGVGIEADRINTLFKIEETFSTPGTDSEKGTGLGLILCKEFIEKQEGKIWVESKENSGSKFSFTLKVV